MRWYLVEGDATGEDDPFSERPLELERLLCRRYFQVIAAGSNQYFGMAGFGSSTTLYAFAPFNQMRATPSCTVTSGTNYYYAPGGLNMTSLTASVVGDRGVLFSNAENSGTAGQFVGGIRTNNAASMITLDARL